MSEPKTITRGEYLQALALYTMACRLQQDVERFNIEMNKILGLDAPAFQDSRFSDGIYARPPEPFDQVLGYSEITVAEES
jgi:hypothetical protein